MGRLASFAERRGIYRNTQSGWVAGVCAGIADAAAIKPIWVRLGYFLLLCCTHVWPAVILYAALTLILKPRAGVDAVPASWAEGLRPDRMFADRVTGGLPPNYGPPPGSRLNDVKMRFTALDARLNRIEATITSDDLALRRKFRDLGG